MRLVAKHVKPGRCAAARLGEEAGIPSREAGHSPGGGQGLREPPQGGDVSLCWHRSGGSGPQEADGHSGVCVAQEDAHRPVA